MACPTTLEDLPAALRLKILSNLPIQETIQASLISPKWRNLWSSLPSLSFEYTVSPPSATTVDSFFHFITGALIRRSHATLSNLSFTFPFTPETNLHKFDINSYISYAVDNNLTSLRLTFSSSYIRGFNHLDFENNICYVFPFYTLKISSVSNLYLTRCNLDLGANLSGTTTTQFTSLGTLFLEQVYLPDDLLICLVKLCGNLEFLTIKRCYGMKHLRIASSKLKKLGLWFYDCDEGSIEITAPALCYLNIDFFHVGRYLLVDSLALIEGSMCFIEEEKNYQYWSKVMRLFSHTNVKKLYCQNWGYEAVTDKELFPQRPSFNNLISLKLDTDYSISGLLGLAMLLEQSPNLETIFLGRCLKLYEEALTEVPPEFVNMKLSLPSLRKLTFDLYWGAEADLYFLKLLLRDQVVLEKIVLLPISMHEAKASRVVIAKHADGFQVVEGTFANEDILQECCYLHMSNL